MRKLWLAVVGVGLIAHVAACGGAASLGAADGSSEGGAPFDATPDGASAGMNACGGTAVLSFDGGAAAPADPCGPCRDGVLVCATPNLLACAGARPASTCPDAGAPVDATVPDAAPHDASTADETSADASSGEASTGGDDGSSDDGTTVDAAPYDASPGWQGVDSGVPVTSYGDGGLPSMTCLSIPTADLVADATRGMLYASVTAASSTFGNGVLRIDPSIPTANGTVFVGSNPNALAVSDDGSGLYVGDDGTTSVLRVDLASGGVGPSVYLGLGTNGTRIARHIAAVPGSSSRYAVSTASTNVSPSFAGLLLYDGTTKVSEWDSFTGAETIAFTSNTRLWGYDNETTQFELTAFDVAASGLQKVATYSGVISYFNVTLSGQGGWLFATNGQAVNGTTGQPVGTYGASGLVWPDPNGQDVWFLDNSYVLHDFARGTFLSKASYSLPMVAGLGTPIALVGIGAGRFAFDTSTNVCVVTVH